MKKALFVIDFIKGIVSGNGTCTHYLQQHPNVIKNTNTLIDAAHLHHIAVFHIRLAFDADYDGLPEFAPAANTIRNNQRFQSGSESTEFISDISQSATDTIINKTYGDVFQGNQLLKQLKQQDIKEIIFTGVATDNAILNSANTAICNDFYVTVVEDACGAADLTAHQNALNIMKGRTASEIITTDKLLEKLLHP